MLERKHRLFKSISQSYTNLSGFESALVYRLCAVQLAEIQSQPFAVHPLFLGLAQDGNLWRESLQAENVKLYAGVRLSDVAVHCNDILLMGLSAGKVLACMDVDGKAAILLERFSAAHRSRFGVDRWIKTNEFSVLFIQDRHFSLASFWLFENELLLTLS